ncbi:MAG: C10 family peptidase, partial [Anaerolineae bacterium]
MKILDRKPVRRLAHLLCAVIAALLLVLVQFPAGGRGTAAPPGEPAVISADEAYQAAESWLRFILKRDGQWAGSAEPSLRTLGELRQDGMTLIYYVSISPRGYIALSPLRDFAPIMAYSTESDLDPDAEGGMTSLLKDVGQERIQYTLRLFGSLEAARLVEIDPDTSARNREVWSRLLGQEAGDLSELNAKYPMTSGRAGPLMQTFWHQRPPYNNRCPNQGCSWPGFGNYNQNAVTGCVPLAMAQIMRYFAWPPSFEGQSYQWTDMLTMYIWDSAEHRFEDPSGT